MEIIGTLLLNGNIYHFLVIILLYLCVACLYLTNLKLFLVIQIRFDVSVL